MSGVISFVLSNPGHHAEIMIPVVRHLQAEGHACQVISIAELRGLVTPAWDIPGAKVRKLMPVRRPIDPPRPSIHKQRPKIDVRGVVQQATWTFGIGPRLRWLLRGSRAVVVPNDAVFPYLQLVRSLQARQVPFVLVQEGIRFKVPVDDQVRYGKNGAKRVCVWGTGSAEYFDSIGVPTSSLCVTGNPRFDQLDAARWKAEGQTVLASLGIDKAPLLFLSNPLETLGYGTVDFELDLFATFLREVGPVLARHDLPLVVKLHSYEDPEEFRAVAARTGTPVIVATKVSLFSLLACARASVVTASTAGLEAMVFGNPLGVLQIPGHGFAFEYVDRGAAVAIAPGTIARDVEMLLSANATREDRARAFIERHLANRGNASERMSQAILSAVGV